MRANAFRQEVDTAGRVTEIRKELGTIVSFADEKGNKINVKFFADLKVRMSIEVITGLTTNK